MKLNRKEMNAKITSELANRSEVKNVPRDLPDTKSESHIGGDQAKDVSDAMKASQSHAGHIALSIISEPQKKPSKEPNQQTSQPTIRSQLSDEACAHKKGKEKCKIRWVFYNQKNNLGFTVLVKNFYYIFLIYILNLN